MSTSESGSRSGRVLELAEEFLDRYRRGERPALQEYVARRPDLADEIREVFPAMAMMEHIALADETIDAGPSPPIAVPPVVQLGDYRILREIGRGGMGVVYEAEQVSLGRHVALKVLPAQMLRDAKTRRRFEREARAAAKLHHTNIVPVFGVGEQGETPYYVMQFIQGRGLDTVVEELKRLRAGAAPPPPEVRDLSTAAVARSLLTGRFDHDAVETETRPADPAAVDRAGSGAGDSSTPSSSSLPLPGTAARGRSKRQTYWQGVARLGEQIADALAYAHAQGIVHRDVKPSNLLLDRQGTVWVTDFGLAKADDGPNLTHSGDVLGTLRYMPPEAFGGKVDGRGDVYALGLTLYEMLAFRPAFVEKDRARLIEQVTGEVPPPLRKLNPEVPRDLETVVQKAIERDPAHRYANASELADDLRRFVDDEPIRARRASYAERLARWGRRNPAIAGLTAAVALLMFSVIAGLWYGNQASHQALIVQTKLRTEAEREKRNAQKAAANERDQAAIAIAEQRKAEAANQALTTTRDTLLHTLYDAQLNLVQRAWDSGGATRMQLLLEAARPKPGEPDLRGFEWHYWRRKLHGERTVRKLPGFGWNSIDSCAFSPDGALIGSVETAPDNGSTLQVYETAAGQLRRRIALPIAADYLNIQGLTFSSDGARVTITYAQMSPANYNQTVVQTHVWDIDGRELFHHEATFRGAIEGQDRASPDPFELQDSAADSLLAFSPDGSRLATAASRGSDYAVVTLWDLDTGHDVMTWVLPNGRPRDLAFETDADRLRVAQGEGEVRVTLLDATPLAPEVEAIDFLDSRPSLTRTPLNSELADLVRAEPGLDPAVRDAALAVVDQRVESPGRLRDAAGSIFGNANRDPAAIRRALAYAERSVQLQPKPSAASLLTLGQARCRSGLFSESIEALRRGIALDPKAIDAHAYLAISEARLGRRAEAEAALAEFRRLCAAANPESTAMPTLATEVQQVFAEAFGPDGGASVTPRAR